MHQLGPTWSHGHKAWNWRDFDYADSSITFTWGHSMEQIIGTSMDVIIDILCLSRLSTRRSGHCRDAKEEDTSELDKDIDFAGHCSNVEWGNTCGVSSTTKFNQVLVWKSVKRDWKKKLEEESPTGRFRVLVSSQSNLFYFSLIHSEKIRGSDKLHEGLWQWQRKLSVHQCAIGIPVLSWTRILV